MNLCMCPICNPQHRKKLLHKEKRKGKERKGKERKGEGKTTYTSL
jgi:hypothetical protein